MLPSQRINLPQAGIFDDKLLIWEVFLDWTFLSLIFGQEDCLASLRSADNCLIAESENFSRGKKSSSSFVFLPWKLFSIKEEYIFFTVKKNHSIILYSVTENYFSSLSTILNTVSKKKSTMKKTLTTI